MLSHSVERESYERKLLSGYSHGGGEDVARILEAEGKFQRGEALLKSRDYGDAATAFRDAIELYGDEGEFFAFLGWALFQDDPNNQAVQRQAEDHIIRGLELNPKIDKPYLFLGYIYKATDRRNEAEEQFEKAIQCNPDCKDALRELRLIEKNRDREDRSSLLSNLTRSID